MLTAPREEKLKRILFIASAAVTCLMACTQAPDLSAVNVERSKPLQRYDVVQSLASNDAIIVGGTQNGAVLSSTDFGKTWRRQQLGPTSLIGLSTCPDGSFIGIDFYRQLWSADAKGGNWKPSKIEKPRTPLAVACDKRGGWWVAGTRATIAVSTDRGVTWKTSDLAEDAQLTTLQFVDDTYGFATGEFGLVAVTSDAGATWTRVAKMPDEFYPYAALFVSREEGWASGLAGQILHTKDGGKTWIKQANATEAALYRLFLHNGVPYGTGANGVVARLEGDAWQSVAYAEAVPVFLGAGVSVEKHATVLAGGPGGLLRQISTTAK